MEDIISKSKQQGRIEYIDILRAIGICSMILGHVNLGGGFNKWIHIFHMPLFFIISGYLYKEQYIKKRIKRRFRTLILPYIFFGIFHIIIYYFLIGRIDVLSLVHLVWNNTDETAIPIAGALWFLTAMFFAELIFTTIYYIGGIGSYNNTLSFSISLLGIVLATYLPFRLPLALDVGMVGVGFFQIGKLLKDHGYYFINFSLPVSFILLVFFSILGFINGFVNLRQGKYSIWPLFFVNAIGISIAFWNICKWYFIWSERSQFQIVKRITKVLKSVGQESIIYLSFNQLIIFVTKKILDSFVRDCDKIIILSVNLIAFLITMIVLFMLSRLITRTKLKWVIGR